jgi:aminomethyltransferase
MGREALMEERAMGPARRLRGLVAEGRQPLRDGAEIQIEGEQVGILTSGNFSPMRERGIGLGLVDADARLLEGDAVSVVQRGKERGATLVRPPLWPVRDESE